jgi:hypothetical protein
MNKILFMLIFILTATFCDNVFSQPPPPPPPAGGHGQSGNQPAGAPIGGGSELLVMLGVGFAAWKLHRLKQQIENKQE